jgi:hypothetical protein
MFALASKSYPGETDREDAGWMLDRLSAFRARKKISGANLSTALAARILRRAPLNLFTLLFTQTDAASS